MKTVIQELIDEVVVHLTYDDNLSEDGRVIYETMRLRLLGKLKKEKEQIKDGFCQGLVESGTDSNTDSYIDEIFNDYYQIYKED